jgi:hypothetical protein
MIKAIRIDVFSWFWLDSYSTSWRLVMRRLSLFPSIRPFPVVYHVRCSLLKSSPPRLNELFAVPLIALARRSAVVRLVMNECLLERVPVPPANSSLGFNVSYRLAVFIDHVIDKF